MRSRRLITNGVRTECVEIMDRIRMIHPAAWILGAIIAICTFAFVTELSTLVMIALALSVLMLTREYSVEYYRTVKILTIMGLPYMIIVVLIGHGFSFNLPAFYHSLTEWFRVLGLSLLILCFYYFSPADRIALWMFQRSPRLALLFALSSRSIPRLTERFQLTAEAFAFRGVRMNEGTLRSRAGNLYRVLRSTLLTTLDECEEVALSYQLRSFPSQPGELKR